MRGSVGRIARRDALTLLGVLGAAACAACANESRPDARAAPPPEEPLVLDPLVDLVPAAGLEWVVEVHPRPLFSSPGMAGAITTALPEDLFATFSTRHGDIDLRKAEEVVVASVRARDAVDSDGTLLALARAPVDPAVVEAAFAARAVAVEGRSTERGVTRLWGSVGRDHEQVAVFGRSAVGLERGRFGPLQIAAYFAQGKLRRALPALRADPLAAAAKRLGDAPVRAFAPGPFEGSAARGLGGLLGASTCAALAMRPLPPRPPDGVAPPLTPPTLPGPSVALTVVLMGTWEADGAAAAERLGAAFRVLADDPLGRLAGLDRPQGGPHVHFDASSLELEVVFDAAALARGVRAVAGGSLAEIVGF